MEPCGDGPRGSLELDILALSQRWEARRTIRTGDTPGTALRQCGKGDTPSRPALAPLAANALAAQPAANPFSLTVQRQKAAAAKACQQQHPQHSQHKQHGQQPSVRFALGGDAGAENRPAAGPSSVAPSVAATPVAAAPASTSGGAPAAAHSAGASPSPYVLFRGRLSFAAEADSARKFDRPTTARRAAGGQKRKLLMSPGADISAAAFPSLRKPAAKQRRRSMGDADAPWASRAAGASGEHGADEAGPSAPVAAAAAGQAEVGGSAFGNYWSDPLPLPASACKREACGAAPLDDDMLDTAASPASSGGGGSCCDSPGASGMEACCCGASPAPPAFSPLPGHQRHALPTVDQPDCGFPSITPRTMRDLLVHGAGAFGLAGFRVVDCRYDHEYAGGHLPGAVHCKTPEEVLALLAGAPEEHWAATALIFHCEFSTERGPRAAKFVRNKDREAHLHDYPALSHPHVFVLQGGYKAFWKAHAELCEGSYTPMDHPDHSEDLKACHNVVKKAWARTTRTFGGQVRQRRPSYRLRQSTGAPCREASAAAEEAAAEEEEEPAAAPPALRAACHPMRS